MVRRLENPIRQYLDARCNNCSEGREMPESLSISTAERSQEILRSYVEANNLRTNNLFTGLLMFQWLACILAAFWLSPLTWHGGSCSIHPHVWMAVVLGGLTVA